MQWLHAGLGDWVALALIAASFVTSLITVAFGLGGGVALLALLASLVPPAALIPIHGLVQLGSNFGRAVVMARYRNRDVLPPFSVGSLIGVALGGSVAVQLPADAIQIGVGLFVIWSIFGTPPAFMRRSASIAGAISSFLTMFFGATGPFIAAFGKTVTTDRLSFVATHATMMSVQHGLKTLAFGLLGFAFGVWAPLIAAMIVAGFLGTLAGRRVLMRIDEARFQFVLNAILFVLALRLIWTGASDWL